MAPFEEFMAQEKSFDQVNPVDEINSVDVGGDDRLAVAEAGYEVIYGHASGGKVWRHELVDVKGIDYNDVLEIAMDKANIGCEVHMLPTLPEDHALRHVIFANAKERKCPDLKINGIYTEIKTPIGDLHSRKINNNVKFAYAQANNVIIRLNSPFNIEYLIGIAKGRFLSHDHLSVIEFKMENKYYRFSRLEFE